MGSEEQEEKKSSSSSPPSQESQKANPTTTTPSSTTCCSFLTSPRGQLLIFLTLISILAYLSHFSPTPKEPSEEDLNEHEEIILRSTNTTKKSSTPSPQKNLTTPYDEVTVGDKRYRLYEKKRLNFKKAEEFCRKQKGRLATTDSLLEMTRLQSLLARARSVTDDIWMGLYSKKAWKKHAWRDKPHPPGINPDALKGMSAMMMGGGREEMCPAMSSSTRASAPAQCYRLLAFICEFDEEDLQVTPPPKTTTTTKRPKQTKNNARSQNKKPAASKKQQQPKNKKSGTPSKTGKPTPPPSSSKKKPTAKHQQKKTISSPSGGGSGFKVKMRVTTTPPPPPKRRPQGNLHKPQRRKVIVRDEMKK